MPTKQIYFYLTHLYPDEMSIYGDMGNIIALCYRLKKLGVEVIYQPVSLGSELPLVSDMYFIGGGQDKEQQKIFKDLLTKKERLSFDVESGVPILAICGGYQLLGQKFITGSGDNIEGLSILPVQTVAPDSSVKSRAVGNVVVQCMIPDLKGVKLVGFENHSGRTNFINGKNVSPLGEIIIGMGDNTDKIHEGCVYKNVIGTYMHGPCLPKNPELCAYLIKKALEVKFSKQGNSSVYADLVFDKVDDKVALSAKKDILDRFVK
jgi:CobQ-like glutamine amidotransferase family enzyme